MTASIESRGTCGECELIVTFTSDVDGNVLDYMVTSGVAVFELAIPSTPGTVFQLTQALRFGENWQLVTDKYVAADGLSVQWLLGWPESTSASTTLTFLNSPAHGGSIIAAGNSTYYGATLEGQITIDHFIAPADILVMADVEETDWSYLWLDDVEDESEHLVDLDGLVLASPFEVALTSSHAPTYCRVTGVVDELNLYAMSQFTVEETGAQTVPFRAVPGDFTHYETSYHQFDGHDFSWDASTVTKGALPTAVEVWHTGFDIQSDLPDSFLVLVDDVVDELHLGWRLTGTALWYYEVPVLSQPMSLPRFPAVMSVLDPNLVREDFVLDHTGAMRFASTAGVGGGAVDITQYYSENLGGMPIAVEGRFDPWEKFRARSEPTRH